MKCPNLILLAAIGLIYNSCLKSPGAITGLTEQSFVSKARKFFDSTTESGNNAVNYKSRILRVALWDYAEIHKYSTGYALSVPMAYAQPIYIKADNGQSQTFHLEDLTRLLIYSGTDDLLHLEVITKYPDSNFLKDPAQRFTGYASIDDWWGNNLGKYLMEDGQTNKYQQSRVEVEAMIRTCTVIYGYNYSPSDPTGGYYWEEETNCSNTYLPESPDEVHGGSLGGGVGTGGGVTVNVSKVAIVAPNNPIGNIADYLKCFTNVGGDDHNYSVTICVQQPVPGTRAAYKWVDGGPIGSSVEGNIVNVGHTFLVFTEHYGGATITRNLGFYPSGGVKPGSNIARGQLNDDETHSYNISVTFPVTNADFFNMLNYAAHGNDPGMYYNLNSENCTTFGIQTLANGGITLPITIGSWPGGGLGCNPGDLGEDLRQMSLPPHAVKGTVENYHPNTGTCL